MRVLVVDDEEMICKAIERLLTLHDYEVCCYNESQKALEAAGTGHFDVILSDVMMPHMSGVELCQALRQLPHLKDTPIIMISARQDDEVIIGAMDRGADDYIVKPFKSSLLLDKIKDLCQKAKEGRLPSKFYTDNIMQEKGTTEEDELIG